MTDHIENIQGATIQHGPLNDTVYLMELGEAEPTELIPELTELATQNSYSKICSKVPASKSHHFIQHNYREEAAIPGFYPDNEAAVFMCSYPNPHRQNEPMTSVLNDIMTGATEHRNNGMPRSLPENTVLRKCNGEDIREMTGIYKMIFPAYPFPVHDTEYLTQKMLGNGHYYAAEIDEKLIALAAAEVDTENQTAKVTDIATRPDWRGKGFASHLIEAMETDIKKFDNKTAYSIVKASSPGMNATFAQLGYSFGGRLINNTPISGYIESMNVWHKAL